MTKENIKQVLISVFIGACVAFFTSLFDGLAQFLQSHSQQIISGAATSATYLAKAYKG